MKRIFTVLAITLSITFAGTTGCIKGDDTIDPSDVAKIIPDLSNLVINVARTFIKGAAAAIEIASTSMVDGSYTVNYSLTGSNDFTGTATMTMAGGHGSFNTAVLQNGGNTNVIINSIIHSSGGSANVTVNNTFNFFDSSGTMTGDLQFVDPFYATDVTASLTGTMLVIDGTMWDPLRTMDIVVRNFNTANMPHTYNFTNISEGSVNYIGNGIKNSAHGAIVIQGITSGVLSGSYSATMADSSTVSGTFKAKYN